MDSCVAEELFYEKLESMKSSRKGKASNLTVYLSDEFYDRAKAWLTAENSKEIEGLSTSDVATIKRKEWTLQHGKMLIQMESSLFQSAIFSRHYVKLTLP